MSKDIIYREDAIKTLTENVMFEFTEDEEWAITCLQNLPSSDRPQGEWIPCSERMPDKSGEYLAYSIISFVPDHIDDPNLRQDTTIVYYSQPFNEWIGNGVEKVLAWMPLPKPWKGASDE